MDCANGEKQFHRREKRERRREYEGRVVREVRNRSATLETRTNGNFSTKDAQAFPRVRMKVLTLNIMIL